MGWVALGGTVVLFLLLGLQVWQQVQAQLLQHLR